MTWSDVAPMAIIAVLIAAFAVKARAWNRSEKYRRVDVSAALLILAFFGYLYWFV